MMILKTVFCPNDTYFDISYNSFDNLLDSIKNTQVILCGWVTSDKYITLFKRRGRDHNVKINLNKMN